MKRPILLALLVCCAGVAGADPVSITLPGLAGDYDGGLVPPNAAPRVRTDTFTIPPGIVTIDRLRVFGLGTLESGWMICERDIGGQTVRDTLNSVPTMRLILTAETLDGGCFFAAVSLDGSGHATDLGGCDSGNPLDPDLLLGTTIQAEHECGFSPPCTPWIDGSANVAEITIVVEGQVVPNEPTTWGEIRALYR